MRLAVLLTFPLALAACAPAVPESGVGFQDYDSYMRSRDAELGRQQPIVPPGFSTESIGAAIDRSGGMGGTPRPATAAVIGAAPSAMPTAPAPTSGIRPRGNAPMGIAVQSGEMVHSSTGISDENDFNAVAGRETIESDRQRIEQNRAQYQVIQPGALPVRQGGTGPNIVDFALATSNPVGVQMYRRSSFALGNPGAKCAGYASPDQAQEAFLQRGGPERDRLGLDPDGDGYACGWDPSPFRIR